MRYNVLFLVLFLLSCNSGKLNKSVSEVLKKSGKNRNELEKVINHYKILNDKEKLEATYFLIGNMKNKYGRYGEIAKQYYQVFHKLHELYDNKTDEDSINNTLKAEWDSIEKVSGPITYENMPGYHDYNIITADYLIENIDMAFKAWKEKPWAKQLNFEKFCEFILPYRVYDEPLQLYRKRFYDEFAWLDDSIKNKSNPLEACTILNNYIAKKFIFCSSLNRCPILGINDMYKLNAGICEHRYYIMASIMRSVGIPVAMDFTPQWNRWAGNHSWLVVLDKTGKARPFNGGEPNISFPDNIYVPLANGSTTKVYRKTYAIQQNPLILNLQFNAIQQNPLILNLQFNDIPQFFKNSEIIDVTDEYEFPQTTVTFKLKIKPIMGTKYIYLCCFGYSDQLVPISYTKLSNDSAKFFHSGKNALYLPVYFINGEYIYANNPIYFPLKGKPEYIVPDKSKLVEVKLTRKCTGGGTMTDYTKWMVGARFQAADNCNFINPVTLFKVDTVYYHFVEKEIHLEKPFRYYRYISSDSGKICIAEIDFVSPEFENISDKSKVFKIYGYYKKDCINVKPIFKNAFDGNIKTNFNALPGSWVAIDYGKPVQVSKIRFLARNDLNIVEIGDEYELFYFDFEWLSLGKKKADKNYIIFNNVPDNALLLLRDLTKGREERIFVYRNGQQIWF